MTWSKFSDDYSDDCWTLSDAAFRLHTEGIVWSNRKLLDCRIPKDDLRRFAKRPEAVNELLAVGWWSDDVDAYYIRHHAAYQRTREQVLARQATNAANGRRGGRPPKPGREQSETPPAQTQSVSQSQSDDETHRDRTGQDRAFEGELEEEDDWPPVRPPGDASTCQRCGGPLPRGLVTLGRTEHVDDCPPATDRTEQP